MKTKIFFFLSAFVLNTMASFPQDSLKTQIMQYRQSNHDFLDKGRRMLLDNFLKNDLQKAKKIKDLLLAENNKNVYEVFYPIEYIYLLYWTEEYKELIDFIKQVDFRQPVSNSVSILARVDNLFSSLFQKSTEHKELLTLSIDNSTESDMDKDFLVLQLEDILRAGQNTVIDYDSEQTAYINRLSDKFLEKYPDSPYEKIIRETIRFRFEPSPWAFYFDVGLGAAITSGGLAEYFDSGGGMEMAFEMRHKKFVGMFGFGFSGHSLKQNIPINNTIWPDKASSTHSFLYINTGYLLLDNKQFSIYPYVGLGFGGISAGEKETKEMPELKKLNLNCFFPQTGLGFDFKFKASSPYYYSKEPSSRISVRYVYRMPQYEKKVSGMSGSTHNIIVSWGFGGRFPARRVH